MKQQLKPLAGALLIAMAGHAVGQTVGGVSGPSNPEILFDNLNAAGGGANYSSIRESEWAASPFSAGETLCSPNCAVNSVVVAFQADSFFEIINFNDFHLEIYSDNGDTPGDTLVGTLVKTSPDNIPIANFTEIFFAPSGTIQLQQNTTYWLKFTNNNKTEDPVAWEWVEQAGGKRAYLNSAFGLLKNSDQQYKMRIEVIPGSPTGNPVPMVLINGSATPAALDMGQNLSITLKLDPAGFAEQNADYWVIAHSAKSGSWFQYQYPAGWATLDSSFNDIQPAYQGPLVSITTPLEIYASSDLPPDTYTVYFGVDRNMNGDLDMDVLDYASVQVEVQ